MQCPHWIVLLGSFIQDLVRDALTAVASWSLGKKIIAVFLCCIFVAVTLLVDVPSLTILRSWAQTAGGGFIVLFLSLYIVITQFPIPRTLLTLTSGVLFGPVSGIIVALTATTISAVVSLLIVRSLLGEWMRPKLVHPAVVRINSHLQRRGWLAVGSLRMIAGIPFSLLNYVVALTPIPVAPFAIATLVGSAPGTAAVVIFGDALTGHINPTAMVFTIGLTLFGILGLVLDIKLPLASGVKSSK